jgi:hypothetical protein
MQSMAGIPQQSAFGLASRSVEGLIEGIAPTIPMTVPTCSAVTSRRFGGSRPICGRCRLSHQPDRSVCCDPTSVASHQSGPPRAANAVWWSRVREAHTRRMSP